MVINLKEIVLTALLLTVLVNLSAQSAQKHTACNAVKIMKAMVAVSAAGMNLKTIMTNVKSAQLIPFHAKTESVKLKSVNPPSPLSKADANASQTNSSMPPLATAPNALSIAQPALTTKHAPLASTPSLKLTILANAL